jgi:hypothetical protein
VLIEALEAGAEPSMACDLQTSAHDENLAPLPTAQ